VLYESWTDDDDEDDGGRLMNGHFFLSFLSLSSVFGFCCSACFFPIALPPSGGLSDEYSVSLSETLS
jgi:hypothetical protein